MAERVLLYVGEQLLAELGGEILVDLHVHFRQVLVLVLVVQQPELKGVGFARLGVNGGLNGVPQGVHRVGVVLGQHNRLLDLVLNVQVESHGNPLGGIRFLGGDGSLRLLLGVEVSKDY